LSSALCAPLEHDGVLLGVLTLGAPPEERFGDNELELVRRLCPRVAAAVSRARRFEAAVMLVDHVDPFADEVRSVSHAIRQATAALRDEHNPSRRQALLDIVDAGASRLLSFAE
jgi:GAF domain-containing protein